MNGITSDVLIGDVTGLARSRAGTAIASTACAFLDEA